MQSSGVIVLPANILQEGVSYPALFSALHELSHMQEIISALGGVNNYVAALAKSTRWFVGGNVRKNLNKIASLSFGLSKEDATAVLDELNEILPEWLTDAIQRDPLSAITDPNTPDYSLELRYPGRATPPADRSLEAWLLDEYYAQLSTIRLLDPEWVTANIPQLADWIKGLENDPKNYAALLSAKHGEAGRRVTARNSDSDNPSDVQKLHQANRKQTAAAANAQREISPDDQKAILDYIAKTLGPKVKVAFEKTLGGISGEWSRDDKGEALIKIALTAANPMSKAHHEAMHEFFQRLLDSESELAITLGNAADSKTMRAQIERFFKDDPNFAGIKDALNDPHERVAYMFELWAAGEIRVGPKTEGVFAKIADFFRKVLGIMRQDLQAEAIMQAFHSGALAEPSAVTQMQARMGKLGQKRDVGEGVGGALEQLLWTAQNTLTEAKEAGFRKIGQLFSTATDSALGDKLSYLDARTMRTNRFANQVLNFTQAASPEQLKAALSALNTNTTPKDAATGELVRKAKSFLMALAQYKNPKVKKVDFALNVFSQDAIEGNRKGFEQAISEDFQKATGREATFDELRKITNSIMYLQSGRENLVDGYAPSAMRTPELRKFHETSLREALIHHAARTVRQREYARRFGRGGERLESMLQDGVREVVGHTAWNDAKEAARLAKKGSRGALTVAEIVKHLDKEAAVKWQGFQPRWAGIQNAISAMDGSLGLNVSPDLKKWSSGLIAYENLRLLGLSLFSQVIDPLGTMVRGGTFNDALNTFKQGWKGTVSAWRGKPVSDEMFQLAAKLGIIDMTNSVGSQAGIWSGLSHGKIARKVNDRLFRWNGVEGFSQGTRVGAMMAAIGFLKKHKHLPEHDSERWLKELNLTPADIKVDAEGNLDTSNEKIQNAIYRWVDGAILRPNAAQRPSWASDPHFALIFHMKQFTYSTQKVLLERVAHELKHGNISPLAAMLVTFVPAMIGADLLRDFLKYGENGAPWKQKWTMGDYLADGVQRAGMMGVGQFAIDAYDFGPMELAGPAISHVDHMAKTTGKAYRYDKYLDRKAEVSGKAADKARADDFNWLSTSTRNNALTSLPINAVGKRYAAQILPVPVES